MARRVRQVKFKFKWTKELTFLLSFLLVLIVATILLALPSKTDKLLERWQAAQLTKETVIKEIKEDKLLSLIEKEGTVFVFYATPDSEDAVNKMKLVEKLANQYEINTTVYWLDATEVHNASEDTKKTKDFKDKIDARESKLQDVDLLSIPSFWVYENGKITVDTADKEATAFENLVSKAFGKYTSK